MRRSTWIASALRGMGKATTPGGFSRVAPCLAARTGRRAPGGDRARGGRGGHPTRRRGAGGGDARPGERSALRGSAGVRGAAAGRRGRGALGAHHGPMERRPAQRRRPTGAPRRQSPTPRSTPRLPPGVPPSVSCSPRRSGPRATRNTTTRRFPTGSTSPGIARSNHWGAFVRRIVASTRAASTTGSSGTSPTATIRPRTLLQLARLDRRLLPLDEDGLPGRPRRQSRRHGGDERADLLVG